MSTTEPIILGVSKASFLNHDVGSFPSTIWNGTLAPEEFSWPFYIGWRSIGPGNGPPNGTSGNTSCSPFPALYDVEVRTISLSASLSESLIILNLKYKFKVQTKGGVQFVTTNITRKSDSFPPANSSSWVEILNIPNSFLQFASLYSATPPLFIGNLNLNFNGSVSDHMLGKPPFLELTPNQFIWGDVLKGIEEMSQNVTAALLTLQLGNISSECFSDQQTVIYQYSPFELWVPYGVSHFSLLSYYEFTVSLIMFYRLP